MYQFHIQELDVEVGDIVVCVSGDSDLYTAGVEYQVEQAADGRLGVMTDCGFIATTSASLFTPINLLSAAEVTCLKTDPTAPWKFPLATLTNGRPIEEIEHNDNFSNSKEVLRRSIEEQRIAA